VTVTHTARAAAARAEDLATVLRSRTPAHPAADVLTEMAAHLDTAARSLATEDAPVLDGITVTNTTPFDAAAALMHCMALALDNPAAGIEEEVFYYVTAPITRRTVEPPLYVRGREAAGLMTRMALAAHDLDALSLADSTSRIALLAILVDLHHQHAELARPAAPVATTADPAGGAHATHGDCEATWRREPVNRNRPELGDTTQFGHRPCGQPRTVDRFVKAAQGGQFIPVYACPAHARS
jgi:hypothetical protein